MDGVLFFYDVCCALGLKERDIYDLLAPRRYLYIAKTTHFAPSEEALDVFDDAISELHKLRWRDGKQLARKKVGPRDTRVFPDIERPTEPGFCTIDLWGPWHLRATNLYLVTVQDRYTRLSACVPARALLYEHETHPGVSTDHWIRAIAVYLKYLLPQGYKPSRLYTDNGVGIVPAFGLLHRTLKYALGAGFTVVFIPPGQPWRNGKLERFPWTLEHEYFLRERPRTMAQALEGLRDYLNWYNFERPHAGRGDVAPATGWEVPMLEPEWYELEYEIPETTTGLIEAIRLVNNEGVVELWQRQYIVMQEIFAGHYVRVQFHVDAGKPSWGRVIWQRKRNEDIVIAEFEHRLGSGKQEGPLVPVVHHREFALEYPQKQLIDVESWMASYARRAKKRKRSVDSAHDGHAD